MYQNFKGDGVPLFPQTSVLRIEEQQLALVLRLLYMGMQVNEGLLEFINQRVLSTAVTRS